MVISELERDYNMTDADLCMFVSNLVGFMTRDAAEFANWGVDAVAIAAFETLGNEFEVFPTDDELKGDVGIASEDKDAKVDSLRLGIRNVSTRAEHVFGDNSARYRKFGVVGMNKMNDRDLLVCSRRVVKVGAGFLAELASEGLTQQILDDLEQLSGEFEDSMNVLKDAVAERDIKTEERRQDGNDLYSFVVKYCDYGKQIWESVSEAKYNDYVIYRTPQELPGKVQNLSFDHLAAAFSWDASPHSETYRLVFRAQGSSDSWTAAYVGPNTSAPYSFDDGDWEIRCRGINSEGKGPWSDLLKITVGLPIPQNVTTYLGPSPDNLVYVNWDGPIPGASRVNVYKSIVPIGDPPGDYIVAGEWSQAPPYYEASTPGVRYYFYCTAYAHYYESPPSEVVFVDS